MRIMKMFKVIFKWMEKLPFVTIQLSKTMKIFLSPINHNKKSLLNSKCSKGSR